jgi:integrase
MKSIAYVGTDFHYCLLGYQLGTDRGCFQPQSEPEWPSTNRKTLIANCLGAPTGTKVSAAASAIFATRDEAENCESAHKASIRNRGLPLTTRALEQLTVGKLLERYRDEVTPSKAGAVYEKYRLNFILNNEPGQTLCARSCAFLDRSAAWDYINARKKQPSLRGTPVTMRTVSRERNLLQNVFEVAREQWGFSNLTNPFRGLKLKGSKYKRTRRLEDGEYKQLISACSKCQRLNKFYLPIGIDLAIETGMREQELFNLRWRDIDFRRRVIHIRKSKTDHLQQSAGRKIVLPWGAMRWLAMLKLSDELEASASDRIFPMTQGAFMQAFDAAVKRAKLEDLEYRNLRREAASRWDELEPPLTKAQIRLMLGHSDGDTTDIYIASELKEIRHKLDLQSTGTTFEEKYAREVAEGQTMLDILGLRGLVWVAFEEFRASEAYR